MSLEMFAHDLNHALNKAQSYTREMGIDDAHIINFWRNPNSKNAEIVRSFFNKRASDLVKTGAYLKSQQEWIKNRYCTAVACIFIEDRDHLENYTDERVIQTLKVFDELIMRG